MRKLIIVLSVFSLLACEHKPNKEKVASVATENKATVADTPKNNSNWINSLRAFRDAVYQNNKAKVKQFIDFPIMNENNEIWYTVEKEENASSEKIKPFTEQDFDKYFNKLFTKQFITSFLKVKTEQLYNTGTYSTIDFKENYTTYRMYATYDKEEKKIRLNLYSETPYKTDDGEMDKSEFSQMYEFHIVNNDQIKFIQIRLAG